MIVIGIKETFARLLPGSTVVALSAVVMTFLAEATFAFAETFTLAEASFTFAASVVPVASEVIASPATETVAFRELIESMVILVLFVETVVVEATLEILAMFLETAFLSHLPTFGIGLHRAASSTMLIQTSAEENVFAELTFERTII